MFEIKLSSAELILISLLLMCVLLLISLVVLQIAQKKQFLHTLQSELSNDSENNHNKIQSRFSALKDALSRALVSLSRSQQSSHLLLQKTISTQASEQRKELGENYQKFKVDVSSQLNNIRETVDEKLQKTLDQRLGKSSEMISNRLESMHKGLGQLQSLAGGINELKQVLSNVKTRGVLGEVLLENLLSENFSQGQYSKNVATKKGSQAHVEFAIKLPQDIDSDVWLPIDSKFPVESAQKLLESRENGDKEFFIQNQKEFAKTIESFAKSISLKYIDPPHTTPFGLMFLPNESLFFEVLSCDDLFQRIKANHNIIVTGPTTISAFLNSLQMGFHTLTIQKRSNEIMNHFLDLKKEFGNYSSLLSKAHKQVGTAYNSLSELEGVRLRAIMRKFENLEKIEN